MKITVTIHNNFDAKKAALHLAEQIRRIALRRRGLKEKVLGVLTVPARPRGITWAELNHGRKP